MQMKRGEALIARKFLDYSHRQNVPPFNDPSGDRLWQWLAVGFCYPGKGPAGDRTICIPYPSPRNNIWLRKNYGFEQEVVLQIQARIHQISNSENSQRREEKAAVFPSRRSAKQKLGTRRIAMSRVA